MRPETNNGAQPDRSGRLELVKGDGPALVPSWWRAYAIALHILALVMLATLVALFSTGASPSLEGVALWLTRGAGMAVAPLAFGLLGLLYKGNRLAGFLLVSWLAVALQVYGVSGG